MHQRAARGVRMQNNQQQRKGPNQQDLLLGMSRRKSCIPDWKQQLKLSIHHVFHKRIKKQRISLLICVTQLGRGWEWNWQQSNDSSFSIRHSKSSSVGGPVGIQHWVRSRSQGLCTVFVFTFICSYNGKMARLEPRMRHVFSKVCTARYSLLISACCSTTERPAGWFWFLWPLVPEAQAGHNVSPWTGLPSDRPPRTPVPGSGWSRMSGSGWM